MVSQILDNTDVYNALGKKALEFLQIQIANSAFQSAQNLSNVLAIQSFSKVQEKKIIYGNIAAMLGKYDLAQQLFLESSQPTLALDMRVDI